MNKTLLQALKEKIKAIKSGGAAKYHEKLREQGKYFVRERLGQLFDESPQFFEDGLFAECTKEGLPADAVITGIGYIRGRKIAFMASDSTVKAGSWGAKTIEKIIRIQETALHLKIPILYLVDSAGARITDQIDVFPGKRHAGRIFYLMVKMSGVVPQVTILFGPSPAGAAYIPAFSDVVIMVKENASAYLGSPRMAEMVIGEKVSLEEMGGAEMHCKISGLGDFLAKDEDEAIALAKSYLSYMPQNYEQKVPAKKPAKPSGHKKLEEIVPESANQAFDMYDFIDALVDGNSFLEIKRDFAPELIIGFACLEGNIIGLIASQPRIKAGTLFVDSSDKGAKFCNLCNAYNIPMLFLGDIPGFMVGSKVERAGIIRHGAKLIAAISQATVPKISVVIRKCYGAGLYAMAGPAFGTNAVLALPTAKVAVMGPEAAINAVYANQIAELPEQERASFVQQKREEYSEDIDIYRLASELIIDAIIPPDQLRDELANRFAAYEGSSCSFSERHNPVYPV